MSYCRANGIDSDVYVIYDMHGKYVCFGTSHDKENRYCDGFSCVGSQEMIDHLMEHRIAGDLVPQGAFARLKRDRNKRK